MADKKGLGRFDRTSKGGEHGQSIRPRSLQPKIAAPYLVTSTLSSLNTSTLRCAENVPGKDFAASFRKNFQMSF